MNKYIQNETEIFNTRRLRNIYVRLKNTVVNSRCNKSKIKNDGKNNDEHISEWNNDIYGR